jgi:Protein of unknown function (DUF1036)
MAGGVAELGVRRGLRTVGTVLQGAAYCCSVRWVAALAFGTCCASAAQAKVNFCNQYDVPVFVSVAYNENGEWVSKGLEKVDPGTYRDNPFNLHVGQFYFFRGEIDWVPTPTGGKRQATWEIDKVFDSRW